MIDQLSYNLINRRYYMFDAMKSKLEFQDLIEKIESTKLELQPLLILGGARTD